MIWILVVMNCETSLVVSNTTLLLVERNEHRERYGSQESRVSHDSQSWFSIWCLSGSLARVDCPRGNSIRYLGCRLCEDRCQASGSTWLSHICCHRSSCTLARWNGSSRAGSKIEAWEDSQSCSSKHRPRHRSIRSFVGSSQARSNGA